MVLVGHRAQFSCCSSYCLSVGIWGAGLLEQAQMRNSVPSFIKIQLEHFELFCSLADHITKLSGITAKPVVL